MSLREQEMQTGRADRAHRRGSSTAQHDTSTLGWVRCSFESSRASPTSDGERWTCWLDLSEAGSLRVLRRTDGALEPGNNRAQGIVLGSLRGGLNRMDALMQEGELPDRR